MPSRSKKARVASLLPLLFFRCSGVDVRADGLAPRKARGGRLERPPDEKAKAEQKRLRESRRAHLRIAFGNARAPCREPRQIWRFRKDAPRASRCPRRGQRQGRKISPRSQRRKATTRSDAKRSRPESEACLDRMSERSTVASRRAGGISPWWSRVCLFWLLGGP